MDMPVLGRARSSEQSTAVGVQPASSALKTTVLPKGKFNAIVKIFCMSTDPDFSMMWQKQRQSNCRASGFCIAGRRILTNAHAVKYFSSVRVRKQGQSRKYPAKVLHVGHDCDLALLTVEEDDFWSGIEPLDFGGIPELQDSVICVGYPQGGDNVSVTQGVVSRVDVSEYAHAGEKLLVIQIDAAINSGNSGGPALMKGKAVGVAFQSLQDAENIGYVVPVPIVKHFLEDIERHGAYKGFCCLPIKCQRMENISLKKFSKLSKDEQGVFITAVSPTSAAAGVLHPGDILLQVDRKNVHEDGTIHFRNDQMIFWGYAIYQFFAGQSVELTVLRQGQKVQLAVPVFPPRYLVPRQLYDSQPSYYVWAGLVFTPLSVPFMVDEFGTSWTTDAPIRLCEKVYHSRFKELGEQIVILNQVLVADCSLNHGYEDLSNRQLLSVNGTKVKNLRQVRKLVESAIASKDTRPFVRFDLDLDGVVVIDVALALQVNQSILDRNNIAEAMSADLKDAAEEEEKKNHGGAIQPSGGPSLESPSTAAGAVGASSTVGNDPEPMDSQNVAPPSVSGGPAT